MKTKFLVLVFVCATSLSYSQKVISGSFSNLKNITEYNVVFDYDGIMMGKFASEEAFLENRMKKHKNEQSAERWKEKWLSDRERKYEPSFIYSFNKRFKNSEVQVDKDIESPYTMKVKTTWMYWGYNVAIARKSSKINATIIVYETANPSNVLLEVSYRKVKGRSFGGGDFDTAYRISESYALLAKKFVKDLRKGTRK